MTETLVRISGDAMGSVFEIYVSGEDEVTLHLLAEETLQLALNWESLLSHYIPSSEISQINLLGHTRPVSVSREVMDLLLKLRRLTEVTQGAFDCTRGRLVREWGLFRKSEPEESWPSAQQLEAVIQGSGWENVVLDPHRKEVSLLSSYTELHLGAAGKGFVVQECLNHLKGAGIECALVHSGFSSISAAGSPPESEGWNVGIVHPLSGEAIHRIVLQNASLSTSGGAEQGIERNGKWYSHLFDPRTGELLEGTHSVSVICSDGLDAEAYSTAFFVQGEEWTTGFCQNHPEIKAIFVGGNHHNGTISH